MPATIRQLSEVIGEDKALALAAISRNRQVYVPKHAPADHPVVQAIGPDAYQTLRRTYGGELVACARAEKASRVRAMKQALVAGMAPALVAERFGVSMRRIGQLLASPVSSNPQRRGKTGPRSGLQGLGRVAAAEKRKGAENGL